MPIQDYEIRPLDLRAASSHEYACYNTFENVWRAEILPDDPPIPLQEETERCRAFPDYFEEEAWAVWDRDGRRMVAFAAIDLDLSGDNPHMAEFTVEVLPECRRQGLGRELLRRIVAYARRRERRLLVASSTECAPPGAQFLARIGACRGLEGGMNQLSLSDLDRSLVARWMDRAGALSEEFCLELWDGPVPEPRLAQFTTLLEQLINDAPHDALELQEAADVAEIFRKMEAWEVAGGRRHWTMVAIYRPTDRVVGLTDVIWSPYRPAIINQQATGVSPDYRNSGLGRWLKAAMLTRILRDLPEARVIRTGNANSNAPMLKLNNELGFKPFMSRPAWQVETETVEKYLAASA